MAEANKVLFDFAARRLQQAYGVGRETLKGLNSGPSMFCGGPDLWEAAYTANRRSPADKVEEQAKINRKLQPQDYPALEQPTQAITERQGEQ